MLKNRETSFVVCNQLTRTQLSPLSFTTVKMSESQGVQAIILLHVVRVQFHVIGTFPVFTPLVIVSITALID